jgi:uncharacterized protein
MRRFAQLLAAALIVLTPVASAWAIEATGYVMDEADVIPAATESRIEAASAALEAETPGAQVAVVTVDSLEGSEREEYAEELFDELGIGSDELDIGVLLLVAIEEREVRIEVGYGLEGAITDSGAGYLLDTEVIPHFREGDMAGGIEAGHAAIVELVRAEYSGENAGAAEAATSAGGGLMVLFIALGLLGLVIAAFIWAVKKGLIKGGSGGSGGSGSSGGGYTPRSYGGGSSGSSSSSGGSFGGGGGFGGFGGGGSGGGGASRGW